MIELHRVWRVFSVGPVKVPALSDVSFRIVKGEFVTLHGASGAGKTTLLRLLYRDDLPSEGEIEVLGHDVPKLRPGVIGVWAMARSSSEESSRRSSDITQLETSFGCGKARTAVS